MINNKEDFESMSISWRVVHRLNSTKGVDRQLINVSTLSIDQAQNISTFSKDHNSSGVRHLNRRNEEKKNKKPLTRSPFINQKNKNKMRN